MNKSLPWYVVLSYTGPRLRNCPKSEWETLRTIWKPRDCINSIKHTTEVLYSYYDLTITFHHKQTKQRRRRSGSSAVKCHGLFGCERAERVSSNTNLDNTAVGITCVGPIIYLSKPDFCEIMCDGWFKMASLTRAQCSLLCWPSSKQYIAIGSIFHSTETAIISTYFSCVRGYVFIFFHCLLCYLLRAHFPYFFVRACLYHCVVFSCILDPRALLFCAWLLAFLVST